MATAIITGASGAIGSAIRDEFQSKTNLEIVGLTSSDCDFRDYSATKRFVNELDLDNVEVIVLCAGLNNPKSLLETDACLLEQALLTNVIAHKLLLDKFIPQMVAAQYGRIVAISSLYSTRARSGRWAYSSSKATQDAMIRSVAVEFGKFSILANSVAPGFVDTPLTHKNNSSEDIAKIAEKIPLNRLANRVEIAPIVRFLASRENSYITGQNILVDGGMSII